MASKLYSNIPIIAPSSINIKLFANNIVFLTLETSSWSPDANGVVVVYFLPYTHNGKKLRKEHRIITYLNQTNDQLSTRYVLVFSSIILRVSPINVIDANKYAYFPLLPCNNFYLIHFFSRLKKRSPYATFYLILFYYNAYVNSSIKKKVTVCNILFDTLLLQCLCK